MGISTRVLSDLASSSPLPLQHPTLHRSSRTLSLSQKKKKPTKSVICNELQSRSLVDEFQCMVDKAFFFDLGHPLLNRMVDSFVKASGIGAVQALSREAYFAAVEGSGVASGGAGGMPADVAGKKRRHFPGLEGETNKKSLVAIESLQWGLTAGMHSGLTYGLNEARGSHDWKNSAAAGAITGVAVAITTDFSSSDQIVQCAITGAAISTAVNLLARIF